MRLAASRSAIGPMRTRLNTSSSIVTRCTCDSKPSSARLALQPIGVGRGAERAGLQQEAARRFGGPRAVPRGARRAVVVGDHDLELRQDLVEIEAIPVRAWRVGGASLGRRRGCAAPAVRRRGLRRDRRATRALACRPARADTRRSRRRGRAPSRTTSTPNRARIRCGASCDCGEPSRGPSVRRRQF